MQSLSAQLIILLMRRFFTSLSKPNTQPKPLSPPRKSTLTEAKPKPYPHSNEVQLNTLINELFQFRLTESTLNINQSLISLSELLIWCEKHNNPLFWQLDQMNIFEQLYPQLFDKDKLAVLQSLVLLVTNIKSAFWVEKMLLLKIVQTVLDEPYNEDQQNYLINLLKCISQRVDDSNAHVLIINGRCLLIEKCAQFVDCQEDMLRTTAMNIILYILNLTTPVLSPFVTALPFAKFYFDICQRLVIRLVRFDSKVLELSMNPEEMNRNLAELDDLIFLIEDLAQVKYPESRDILMRTFYNDVVLATVLKSLTMKEDSPLSIQVAVFMLVRLTGAMTKLGIQDDVLEILFSDPPTSAKCYSNSKMSRDDKFHVFVAALNHDASDCQYEVIESIRQNILVLLTCKDDNLLYLLTFLLVEILRSTAFSQEALSKCGLFLEDEDQKSNATRRVLLDIFIKQFKPPFRVITFKNLAFLILKLSQRIDKNSYVMQNAQMVLFEEVYMRSIAQIKTSLQGASINSAIQYFQYDSRYIQNKALDIRAKVGREAFMIPGEENTNLGFYQRCPTNSEECVRLDLIIFGILRQIRYIVFASKQFQGQDFLFSRQFAPLVSTQNNFKSKELHKSQDKVMRCSMLCNSVWVLCNILDDRTNFIVAVEEFVGIRVLINLKFKYLYFYHQSPKDLAKITVRVKTYNSGLQQLTKNDDLLFKAENFIMGQWILAEMQGRVKESTEKELAFLRTYLDQNSEDAALS